jgi:hypothetical protein
MVSRRIVALLVVSSLAAGCAGESRVRPFVARAPLFVDHDTTDFTPRPEPRAPAYLFEAADKTVFRPVSRFFAVDPSGEAANANAYDEVADSSWFESRIGTRKLTPEEIARGACPLVPTLDEDANDGTYRIDKGKTDGASPGFRVKLSDGRKALLKPDNPGEPELASAASAISGRLYYAFGFHVPCDTVAILRRGQLAMTQGLTKLNNAGTKVVFDETELEKELESAKLVDGRFRFGVSAWLEGFLLGPFAQEGRRKDDWNDVVPHQKRRELRGARLLAAWVDHWDAREQNAMDVWRSPNSDDPRTPGHVVHYILDLSDTLGGNAQSGEEMQRRIGHAYNYDFGNLGQDFVTLGIPERPWDHAMKSPPFAAFEYFSAENFEPDTWRMIYPNPDFSEMTERDGAWAARIIARFSDEDIEAAVSAGRFSDPKRAHYLAQQLSGRRDRIARRFLGLLSPLAEVTLADGSLCATDRADESGAFRDRTFRYRAMVHDGLSLSGSRAVPVRSLGSHRVCVAVGTKERYATIDIDNGVSKGSLRAHIAQDQAGSLNLVGVERPPP